jgi:NitT/TauT family transport system permease protein
VLEHATVTTTSMLLGYALGIAVALPLAMALAYSRLFEAAVYPSVVFLQILPKIAIAPLFIIWFGFGMLPKLLLVFLLTFFPIVVSAVAGFKSCDPDIIELARATGTSRLRLFLKIRFPSALPEIFTGLKVAAALASTAAVVAEFVSSDAWLGYLLLTFNGELLTSMVFGTIIILGVIGLALYYLVEGLERLIIPWHVAARGEQTLGKLF